jgi:hypothetical protein
VLIAGADLDTDHHPDAVVRAGQDVPAALLVQPARLRATTIRSVSEEARASGDSETKDERCVLGINGYSIVSYLKAVYRIQCPLDERAASNTYCSPLSHLEGLCSFVRSELNASTVYYCRSMLLIEYFTIGLLTVVADGHISDPRVSKPLVTRHHRPPQVCPPPPRGVLQQ